MGQIEGSREIALTLRKLFREGEVTRKRFEYMLHDFHRQVRFASVVRWTASERGLE
jgi:hypothetical protein